MPICPKPELMVWSKARDMYEYPAAIGGTYRGCTRAGTRLDAIAFENAFGQHAREDLNAWYAVVSWKLASQGGRAKYRVNELQKRIAANNTTAPLLWDRCQAFLADETRASFTKFQQLLFNSHSLAVAMTFPAFACPERFPMVDTRVALYMAHEGARHGFYRSDAVLKTLSRYRERVSPGVLTCRDWPFVQGWIEWSRTMAQRLSSETGSHWRARDVDLAVFRAWGERRERAAGLLGPRYQLPA